MPPPASGPGARPSLLRSDAPDAPAHDTLRMLASLEAHKAGSKAAGKRHGAERSLHRTLSPGRPSAVRAWVIGGLVLTMVALAMAYLTVLRTADAPSLSSPRPAIGPQAQAESRPTPGTAAIETLPEPARDNSAPRHDERLVTPSTASAQAPESPFNALSVESAAPTKATVNTPAMSTTPPPDIARVSGPPELPAEAPPARLSPAQLRQAARAGDSALLAALVQHVAAHSRQEVKGAMPPLRLKGSKTPMTTIAQIVDHCRSLEGEEAKVCKVRICENYWGKDDACSTRPDFHRFETSER